jgi:hypothetical protein
MTNSPKSIPHPWQGDDLLTDAYKRGWYHGHGVACHNVPTIGDRINKAEDYIGLGDFVTADNIREYHQVLTHAGADHSRDYSPFEFTAHEFNESEYSEDLWEAFEAGTNDAIEDDLSSYTDEDYGIEQGDEAN